MKKLIAMIIVLMMAIALIGCGRTQITVSGTIIETGIQVTEHSVSFPLGKPNYFTISYYMIVEYLDGVESKAITVPISEEQYQSYEVGQYILITVYT